MTETPYADWKKESMLDTFPLALYKKLMLITPVEDSPTVLSSLSENLVRTIF